MVPRIDRIGRRYGKLVVLELSEIRKGVLYFLCQCDCGNKKVIRGTHLGNGGTQSCRRCLPQGESSFNILYAQRKNSSQRRKIDWNLSKDYFRWITHQPCHYCGEPPYQKILGDNCNGEYIYNGIDRVNNDIGYVEGNCVPCCGTCNYAKQTLDVDDFKDWVKSVYNHWASR